MENMFLIEKNGVKFYLTVRDLIRMLYGLERYDFRWEVEEECKDWILPFRKEDPELLSFSKPEVTNRGKDYVMSYDMFSLPIKNEKCFFMNDIPVAEFTGNVFLSDGLDTNDYYYFLLRVDDKFVMLDLNSVGTCLCFAAENGILAGEIPESHWFHFCTSSQDFEEYYENSSISFHSWETKK